MRGREDGPPAGGLADATEPPGCGAGNAGAVPDRSAALEAAKAAAAGGGVAALVELARVADSDPLSLAIAGWELLFDGHPGLTRIRRGQLERACSVLDRLRGRRGYGVELLLAQMDAVACDVEDQREGVPTGSSLALGRHPAAPPPATLNYFVARLRFEARSRRRSWRQATRGPGAPGSSGGGSDA